MDTSNIEQQQSQILVVDDTPANLQLLTNLLSGHGYTAYPASDGRLALEFVRKKMPDLILLDIRMPGMDGFEVCRRLKEDEKSRDIPVIFISILENEDDKVKGFAAGAVDFIHKPFQPAEVLARINTHLKLRALTKRLEQLLDQRTAALLAREEQMRLTLEATRIGTFDWDVVQDVWTASSIYYTMLGYVPKEGPRDRQEWAARLHPDDRESVEHMISEVLRRENDNYQYEARLRHADGTYRWQYVQGFAVEQDAAGRISRIVGVRMDIHERKQLEKTLQESEEMFRTLAVNTPDCIARYDLDCRLLYMNPALEKFLGRKSSELVGTTPMEKPHIDVPRPYQEKILMAAATGEETRLEMTMLNRGQGERYYDICFVPERDADGVITGVLAIGRDVTDRRQIEVERAIHSEHLEEEVKKRTVELENSNRELAKMNELFVGRELKMIELKKRIRELEKKEE